MERLTEWNREHTHGQLIKGDGYTKLAQYEDTGLEPEEIADFRELYREMSSYFADYKALEVMGRLAILPCKLGDTVYSLVDGEVKEETVKQIFFDDTGEFLSTLGNFCGRVSRFSDIGKTVFLSLDEAEVALKERKKSISKLSHGVIDLNRLNSIAEEHGAEIHVSGHPGHTTIFLDVTKDNVRANSEIDARSCSLKLENGVPVVESILMQMIERLEELLHGRTNESGVRPGG